MSGFEEVLSDLKAFFSQKKLSFYAKGINTLPISGKQPSSANVIMHRSRAEDDVTGRSDSDGVRGIKNFEILPQQQHVLGHSESIVA